MDKYIKIMLIKLSNKYDKVTITHIQSYNKEKNKLVNIYKFRIKDKRKVKSIDCYSKRTLVQEMMKWVEKD